MTLKLVMAPDPVFKKVAEKVEVFDDHLRQTVDDMFAVLYREHAVGIGANMVDILKRIIVVDLQEEGEKNPVAMINPELVKASEETQTMEEASRSFPGISAEISRPANIEVRYQDCDGNSHTMKASGFLSQVIQHEMDYLDGKVFLDYVSSMKRKMLMKKMKKYVQSMHHNHVHGPNCGC